LKLRHSPLLPQPPPAPQVQIGIIPFSLPGKNHGARSGDLKVFLAGAADRFPFLKLFSTIPNSYVSGTVDLQQINGAGVSPTFGFAIGADFK
jgi:hypothetical protein